MTGRIRLFLGSTGLATSRLRLATPVRKQNLVNALRFFSVGLFLWSVPAATLANRYRDNPDRALDQRLEGWASPVGRLETVRQVSVDGVQGIFKGTGFLVSPCFVLTAAHVVSPDSDALLSGIVDPHTDFRMVFRVRGQNSKAPFSFIANIDTSLNDLKKRFLRSFEALSGRPASIDAKDFIFLRLPDTGCVGAWPGFGWFEASQHALVTTDLAAAVGYPKSRQKGEVHLGTGQIGDTTPGGLFQFSGSYKVGESGGPLLIVQQGRLRVAGLIVAHEGSNASQEYPTYSPDSANEILSLVAILNDPPIKAIIDADKIRFGDRNPAERYQEVGELPK